MGYLPARFPTLCSVCRKEGQVPTIIKGQPTSKEVIARLASEGKPVLLAFSCGKDSIATWIALEDGGVEVVPCYLWIVPHLAFVDEELAYFEQVFGRKIHTYPHASFYRLVNNAVAQAPERLRVIEAAQLPTPTHAQIWGLIREDLGLENAWCADGVRAADSIVRRASFVKHGVIKQTSKKVSPIADWLKGEVMGAIERRSVELPVDYELFGRSFDGIDNRFISPMKKHLPEDYARLCEWFPMIEADIKRWEHYGNQLKG
jgi:hypothetical protein